MEPNDFIDEYDQDPDYGPGYSLYQAMYGTHDIAWLMQMPEPVSRAFYKCQEFYRKQKEED